MNEWNCCCAHMYMRGLERALWWASHPEGANRLYLIEECPISIVGWCGAKCRETMWCRVKTWRKTAGCPRKCRSESVCTNEPHTHTNTKKNASVVMLLVRRHCARHRPNHPTRGNEDFVFTPVLQTREWPCKEVPPFTKRAREGWWPGGAFAEALGRCLGGPV